MKTSESPQFKDKEPTRHNPYVMVPKHLLQGPKALGLSSPLVAHLLLFLNALPEGAPVSTPMLVKEFGICRNTCGKCINELERIGYVHRHRVQSSGGTFEAIVWRIFDEPTLDAGPPPTHPDDYKTTAHLVGSGDQSLGTSDHQMRSGAHAMTPLPTKCVVDGDSMEDIDCQSNELNECNGENPAQSVGALVLSTSIIPVTVIEQDNKENKEKAPTPRRRALTEVGEVLSQEYSKWRLEKHGQAYDLAKISDGAAKAFNSMGQTLLNKHVRTIEDAGKSFARILGREGELDAKYYQPKLFSPTRMEQEFLAIVNLLARKPGAPAPQSTITAPEQYTPTQRNYYLNYLNMWRRKFGLPKVESFGEQDVQLCKAIADAATHSQRPPHPKDTHCAAEWQNLNQPVNA